MGCKHQHAQRLSGPSFLRLLLQSSLSFPFINHVYVILSPPSDHVFQTLTRMKWEEEAPSCLSPSSLSFSVSSTNTTISTSSMSSSSLSSPLASPPSSVAMVPLYFGQTEVCAADTAIISSSLFESLVQRSMLSSNKYNRYKHTLTHPSFSVIP
jgi:hypothetical protein